MRGVASVTITLSFLAIWITYGLSPKETTPEGVDRRSSLGCTPLAPYPSDRYPVVLGHCHGQRVHRQPLLDPIYYQVPCSCLVQHVLVPPASERDLLSGNAQRLVGLSDTILLVLTVSYSNPHLGVSYCDCSGHSAISTDGPIREQVVD